jgi:murein DD-endopeptidase MepM/ murein hydrolase activator NlpD
MEITRNQQQNKKEPLVTKFRGSTKMERARGNAAIFSAFMIVLMLSTAITFTVLALNRNTQETGGETYRIAFHVPVEGGEIIQGFCSDSIKHFKSSSGFGFWTAHEAVSIAAAANTHVLATYGGTITDISRDATFGTQITITHANGYKTVYSGLLDDNTVSTGAHVQKGQRIGTAGHTIMVRDGFEPHIMVEVFNKDGEPIDPEKIIAFPNK